MNLKVITKSKVQASESQINAFLSNVFNSVTHVDFSDEFVCAVVITSAEKIIACGCAYTREMSQGTSRFKAGIIGSIAVSKKHRGKGFCRQIMKHLDNELQSITSFSFLFAYQTKIYQSSGYTDLLVPIHYFDKPLKQWKQFVYRGGMVKAFTKQQLVKDQVVEFEGCVY